MHLGVGFAEYSTFGGQHSTAQHAFVGSDGSA